MGSTRNSCRLLLDVGGTFLKSAVADAAGQLLSGSEFSCPIRSEGSREEIEGSLAAAVARGAAFAAERGMELAGIGIAIPGPFDYAAGVSRMTHKFRSICGVDLRDVLHAMPGVPADAEIRFMQDVNAALAGEIARGNAAGYGASALVSLGTGLGFALSRDGRVLCNPAGGPKVVIFNLPYRDGILEDYASKRGFLRICGPYGPGADGGRSGPHGRRGGCPGPRDLRNGRGHPCRGAPRPARRTRRRMPPAGRSDFAFVRPYGSGPARRTARCRGADPHRTRGAYRRSGLLRSAGLGGRRLLTCGRCGKPFIRAIVSEPAGMSKYLIAFIFLSLQERRLPLLFSNRRDHD